MDGGARDSLLLEHANVARFLLLGHGQPESCRYEMISYRCLFSGQMSGFPRFRPFRRHSGGRADEPRLYRLCLPDGWPRQMSDPLQLFIRDGLLGGQPLMLLVPFHCTVPPPSPDAREHGEEPVAGPALPSSNRGTGRDGEQRSDGVSSLFDPAEFSWAERGGRGFPTEECPPASRPRLALVRSETATANTTVRREVPLGRVGLSAVWLSGGSFNRPFSYSRLEPRAPEDPDADAPEDLASTIVRSYNRLHRLLAEALVSPSRIDAVGLFASDGMAGQAESLQRGPESALEVLAYQRICLPTSPPLGYAEASLAKAGHSAIGPYLVYAVAQSVDTVWSAVSDPYEEYEAIRELIGPALNGGLAGAGAWWYSFHCGTDGHASDQKFISSDPPLLCYEGDALKTWRRDGSRRDGVTVFLQSQTGRFYVHNRDTDAFTRGSLGPLAMRTVAEAGRFFADFCGLAFFTEGLPASYGDR